jgi:hypothetical protein
LPESKSNRSLHAKLGVGLIALGIAGILWGVFHILDAAQGSDPTRRSTYDEVKPRLHRAFPGGLARGLAGLGVAMIGGRVLAMGRGRGDRTGE